MYSTIYLSIRFRNSNVYTYNLWLTQSIPPILTICFLCRFHLFFLVSVSFRSIRSPSYTTTDVYISFIILFILTACLIFEILCTLHSVLHSNTVFHFIRISLHSNIYHSIYSPNCEYDPVHVPFNCHLISLVTKNLNAFSLMMTNLMLVLHFFYPGIYSSSTWPFI